MSAEPVETFNTLVVTVPVPCADGGELSVEVIEHEVTVVGPDGFRHEVTLPFEADMGRLSAQLYMGILELRAPRLATPVPRLIEVRTLA